MSEPDDVLTSTLRPPRTGRSRPYDLGVALEENLYLDGAVDVVDRLARPIVGRPPVRRLLGGRWLGHSLHPLMTDLPIGAWTSAMLLDLFGGRRAAPAATALVAFGVATAAPTAATGVSDWLVLDRRLQRVGVVHALTNDVATACYAASLVARLRGRRATGIKLGLVGGLVATVGGLLGGHLAVARGAATTATEDVLER